MPNELTPVSFNGKKISFWNTKEGTTGLFIGLGLLGLGGFALYNILPFLITLMANTITFIALLAVLAVMVIVILDGKLPRLLWMFYKRLMWALTYSFIKYDPAWVARDRQKAVVKKLQDASDARGKLKGEQKLLDATIAGFQADVKKFQSEANYLQSHGGSTAEIRSRTMRLQEAMNAINELQPGADQVKMLDGKLKDVLEILKETNDTISYKIEAIIRKYEGSKALGGIMGILKSAFRGSEDVEGMRDTAMNIMSEESERQFGQIDAFLDDVEQFMNGRKVSDAIKADDGLKLLEDLNARTIPLKIQSQPATLDLRTAIPATSYWTKEK